MASLSEQELGRLFRSFTRWVALALAVLISLPTLYGIVLRPEGALYLGLQHGLDDHMVYWAWTKQAQGGSLLFRNLFTNDPQPGLTLHLYFLGLGWVSKVTGIPVAMWLARVGFAYSSVILLGRLIEHMTDEGFRRKVCLTLAVFGMGIGFTVWHNFGVAIVKPAPALIGSLLGTHLPIDVWQSEAFLFSGALTNGLFMVSATLILGLLVNILEARSSKLSVLKGGACAALLMNIHSYDVLLVGLVLIGFAAALLGTRSLPAPYFARCAAIMLGTVPFAAWFIHVLRSDPVFQARAATETYSPAVQAVLGGLGLLLPLGLLAFRPGEPRRWLGVLLGALAVTAMLIMSRSGRASGAYWIPLPIWCLLYASALASLLLLKIQRPAAALLAAWALIGLIAPYFPALFQRKLLMLIGVPWGILAGLGLALVLERRERSQRNLLTALLLLIPMGSSLQWVARELSMIRTNTSHTTVHEVYQHRDVVAILRELEPLGKSAVVAALPGLMTPSFDASGNQIPDSYDPPIVPDLNPIAVGLAGTRSYASHWSETPKYGLRRQNLTRAMLQGDAAQLRSFGCTHVIVPMLPSESISVPRPETFGQVLVRGTRFALVRL